MSSWEVLVSRPLALMAMTLLRRRRRTDGPPLVVGAACVVRDTGARSPFSRRLGNRHQVPEPHAVRSFPHSPPTSLMAKYAKAAAIAGGPGRITSLSRLGVPEPLPPPSVTFRSWVR